MAEENGGSPNTLNRGGSWRERLTAAGLDGLAEVLLDAARPLGPVVSQFVWIAQPAFALFGRKETADLLADLLNAPAENHSAPTSPERMEK